MFFEKSNKNDFLSNRRSQVLQRDDIKRIFVGMEVPGYEPTEYESEDIPKPKEEKHVHFNFRNCFPIDPENNLDKRDLIAQMIQYPNHSSIRLVVVSLPINQDEECEDIGHAFIDINDILKINQDFFNQALILYDPNDNNTIIGKMVVTAEMHAALISIKNELETNNIEN